MQLSFLQYLLVMKKTQNTNNKNTTLNCCKEK